MNNEQFKFGIKVTVAIFIIIIVIIIGVLIYVFNPHNAEVNIYSEILSNIENDNKISEISLETKGIDKQEFESYLSSFALLEYNKNLELSDEEAKNIGMINAAANFLDIVYLKEEQLEDESQISYEADKVNKIIREMNGEYIEKNINVSKIYTFNEEQNTYSLQSSDKINSIFINLDEVTKTEDKIQVIYEVIFPTEEEYINYTEKKPVEIETYKIRATLLENEEYEYSKYYVSSINTISKEKVKYN